jgi:hypothetical protein
MTNAAPWVWYAYKLMTGELKMIMEFQFLPSQLHGQEMFVSDLIILSTDFQ